MNRIVLDLNQPSFQEAWFALQQSEVMRVIAMLRKLAKLSWRQLYQDPGLRWEAITSRKGPRGQSLYSIRASQKIRVVVHRDGDILRLLEIHPGHDSAYQ